MLPKLDSGSSLAHGTIPFYMQPKLIGWHVESKIALTENVCTCVHLKLYYILWWHISCKKPNLFSTWVKFLTNACIRQHTCKIIMLTCDLSMSPWEYSCYHLRFFLLSLCLNEKVVQILQMMNRCYSSDTKSPSYFLDSQIVASLWKFLKSRFLWAVVKSLQSEFPAFVNNQHRKSNIQKRNNKAFQKWCHCR